MFVPVGSTYANLMLLPQIPHAAELTGEDRGADPRIPRPCFAGGTWCKLTINPGRGLINIAHNLTIAVPQQRTGKLTS